MSNDTFVPWCRHVGSMMATIHGFESPSQDLLKNGMLAMVDQFIDDLDPPDKDAVIPHLVAFCKEFLNVNEDAVNQSIGNREIESRMNLVSRYLTESDIGKHLSMEPFLCNNTGNVIVHIIGNCHIDIEDLADIDNKIGYYLSDIKSGQPGLSDVNYQHVKSYGGITLETHTEENNFDVLIFWFEPRE